MTSVATGPEGRPPRTGKAVDSDRCPRCRGDRPLRPEFGFCPKCLGPLCLECGCDLHGLCETAGEN